MKGKDFIEMALGDFEDFYIQSDFKVQRIYQDCNGLKVSGNNEKARLAIPNEFAQMDLEEDSEKFYALLLIGHEVAHYINKHNYYAESEKIETRAIEMWADYFGTVIAMSLFLLGKNTSKRFSFKPNSDKESSFNMMCGAFERIYEIYKNADGQGIYEHSSSRILIITTGITSFLIRLEISKLINEGKIDIDLWSDTYLELSKAWTYEFILFSRKCKALFEAYMNKNLISLKEEEELEKIQKVVQKIHIQIIGNAREITEGIHPVMKWILGTDFNTRPDITYKAKEYIRKLEKEEKS